MSLVMKVKSQLSTDFVLSGVTYEALLLNSAAETKNLIFQLPRNFFVNKYLTPTQRAISLVLRKAKLEFPRIVSGSNTFDGEKFIIGLKPLTLTLLEPETQDKRTFVSFLHGCWSHQSKLSARLLVASI